MKKTIAILMCAIMLAGAAFACFASAATTTKTEGGPLAITEINYAPAEAKYEYIEVVNTGSAAVNLKDYYVYRFAFSNGGSYLYSGILQMFGVGGRVSASTGDTYYECGAKLVKVSMADIDQQLAPKQVALIWFASAAAKDNTVADFKAYWTLQGADMTNVTVVKLPVYDANGNNLYAANDTTGGNGTIGPNANSGNTFLPDKQAGFVISLINKSFADTDTISTTEKADFTVAGSTSSKLRDFFPAKTRARHAAADCSAMAMLFSNDTGVQVLEYYDFVDKTKLTAALEATTFQAEVVTSGRNKKVNLDEVPAGFMAAKRSVETKEEVYVYNNKNSNAAKIESIAFLNQPGKSDATPGKLLSGQIGYDPAANNPTSETTAPETTTAPVTTAPETTAAPAVTTAPETTKPAETTAAPAEEKSGCGSSIAVTGIAVLATVGACAAVVSKKRKED